MQPKSVKLSESPVQLDPDGAIRMRTGQGYPMDAWQVGEVQMTESSRHGGERHVDGDELVYLISGSARVSLEHDDEKDEVVALQPGEAFVVPQETWHRVLIDEPSGLLFFGIGRTEVRAPTRSS